ncbi:TetR family transcriptional regulator [Glycomyces tenuis]|uniref:acyl-CoA-like ligand-binding transcription factor n=1 Tax=Glycomyces tenuis TaxID=58116 RepID=UPI000402E472|nr:TetR family transcriptional regulator [Glycomyces tenuis]
MEERVGLRERKRRAAMRRVQEVALDLFDEHGFDAVTVKQIAEAAGVAPSSVYRYFETKEGIVLYDPNRIVLSEPARPEEDGLRLFEALYRTITAFVAEHGDEVIDRRRTRYLMEVPSVRTAVAERIFTDVPTMASFIAERTGRSVDELEVQVAAGAFAGGLLAAVRHWHAEDYAEPLGELLERTLATLRDGLEVSLE